MFDVGRYDADRQSEKLAGTHADVKQMINGSYRAYGEFFESESKPEDATTSSSGK